MKSRWVGLVGVVVLAFSIIGYKQVLSPRRAAGPVAPPSENARVILVADPREAESKCGCGEIIKAVRAARSKGVPVQELPPNSESELLKRYRILTAPGFSSTRKGARSPVTKARTGRRLRPFGPACWG